MHGVSNEDAGSPEKQDLDPSVLQASNTGLLMWYNWLVLPHNQSTMLLMQASLFILQQVMIRIN